MDDTNSLTCYSDGGTVGQNPSHALYGSFRVGREEPVRLRWGGGSNNDAEYLALIALLEALESRGITRAICWTDSQLVVRQVSREYAVRKPNLIPLWARASDLIARGQHSLKHCYRSVIVAQLGH